MTNESLMPDRLIRFCGADCGHCDRYKHFLAGDESVLVDPDDQYRCCWLPRDYPRGRGCEIRMCCEERGILFCGECGQFEECARMDAFYSQLGYEECKKRMLEEVTRKNDGILDNI